MELWGSLLNGALVLATDDHPSLTTIGRMIQRQGVTSLWFTAGLFHAMVGRAVEDLGRLRQLLAGGDVLSPSHVPRALAALPGCQSSTATGRRKTDLHLLLPIAREGWGGGPVPIGVPMFRRHLRAPAR